MRRREEINLIMCIYGGLVGVLTAYLGKEKLDVLEKFQFARNWRGLESQQTFLASLSQKLKHNSILYHSHSPLAYLF